jgi:hypothetical protein
MSAIRGLFQFALDMAAFDVMFNPAKGVKVRKPEKDRKVRLEVPSKAVRAHGP